MIKSKKEQDYYDSPELAFGYEEARQARKDMNFKVGAEKKGFDGIGKCSNCWGLVRCLGGLLSKSTQLLKAL